MGDEGWEARMSVRAADRERRRVERARAEREEREERWASLAPDEIPAEHREHHHHARVDGYQCSCGALMSVTCFIPPGPDVEPWECAACGEEWATYAGPPRHGAGEISSSFSGGWVRVDTTGGGHPIEWRDGSTWTESADWPGSYPVVDPDTGQAGQHVEPGVYQPVFNGDGTVSLYRIPPEGAAGDG